MRIITGLFFVAFISVLVFYHSFRITSLKYQLVSYNAANARAYRQVLDLSLLGIKINPFNINLRGFAGIALINLKRPDQALEHLSFVLKYYPNNLNALYNTALAYQQLGNTEKFLSMARRVEKINPKYVKRS